MPLSIGQTLHNRYRIAKLVGQGGFGAVYRAWDMALEQPVALKENTLDGGNTQRQFEREAKLLAGLRHPNLPRVIDHFIIPGQGQYLVMDFVEGKSLATLLRERGAPFEEADAVKWVRQVSDALTYLHSRTPPVIHRDIKPDNIIIAPDGRAMLVDFGISKIFDESKGTTTGARAVTHGYSPLEQYGRGKTDARSDVYSLGATLYTLLTGMVPPDAVDLINGSETLLPPNQINRALSATTSAAILSAMTPSISQRLDSVAGFEQLLTTTSLSPSRGTVIAPMTVEVSSYTALPDTTPGTPPSTPPPDATSASSGTTHGPAAGGAKRGVPMWGWLVGVLALVVLGVWAALTFGGQNGGGGEATAEAATARAIAAADTPRVTATTAAETTPATTATATAEPQMGDIRTAERGGVEVEQVFVPAGSFMMGSEDGFDDEQPVHEVTLDAFWMDRMEVTNAQFELFVADTGFQTTAEQEGGGFIFTDSEWTYTAGADWRHPQGPASSLNGLSQHPVVLVSWDDATAFCEWAGGRLPTEAEWEYAARGPEGLNYPWGNTFDGRRLNYCDENCPFDLADQAVDDGYEFTAPVASYANGASWIGALDMAGNVWEWVNDWYNSDYYRQSPDENPSGPVSGEYRVLRGGAWLDNDSYARSSYRLNYQPDVRYNSVGFRCAQE